MTDVFISYASEDRARIQPLVSRLEDEGLSVWWDRELVAGPDFEDEIEKALHAAACVVVAWSEHSVGSSWCRAEANEGLEAQCLVPMRIDAVRPPLRFREAHTASLVGWPDDAGELAVLLDGVRACLARRAPAAGGDEVRLAVLPFDNLSGDPDLTYFSDGVSEEVLQTVAGATGIAVIGRSSSFQFRGADKAAARVSAELGCTHVLDGSVRRAGERVRIGAQLIECAGSTTVWSQRFDRQLTDVFALQDEIAAAVADALQVAFQPSDTSVPIDPEAYDLYLRAKTESAQWLGAQDTLMLEAAVAREPRFAQAWAALAVSRAIEAYLERDPERSAAPRAQAIEAAGKALELEPKLGAARAALSITEPLCGRYQARDEQIDQALAANPRDPVVLFWGSRWCWSTGRINAALALSQRLYEADPLWAQGLHHHRGMLERAGRDAESRDLWRRIVARWPRLPYVYAAPLTGAATTGDWDYVDEIVDALGRSGLPMQVRGAIARQAGSELLDFDRILRAVDRLRNWSDADTASLRDALTAQVERTGTLQFYVQWACEVGLTDHVYRLLEQASFEHLFQPGGRPHARDFGLYALFLELGTRSFQCDVRFVRLCARLGLVDYWATYDKWPDIAGHAALPYDFRAEAAALTGRFPAPAP